ncbi:23S rRNA (uridine(2552)-2'-O-)-methyltransferase [Vittaforma corneae ATCC 50505]|uniref:23S rRNA (Uridine(2552)-2'-O-)-methyltransferase n=1 Tax=Vittaforma corneae (strain ATCC 50505) TaxID=993615 RepID=L2GN11_VITCO|nr:23S rRNA (uridine(2552)-2'-O-)-methyltransferase [Vittaforma corneae ATCC 50505]ELA41890.1 23S rRNA (uridine(2552)-2'-O-)-methyltransferase [Vittaforma corneae ATCC 50505]
MGIPSKDRRDYYYYQAKALGYRARSAFKLLDINEAYRILESASKVIDLCAAPGSWSQVLASHTKAKIVAVDIQDMAPINGVTILKEDITSGECLNKIFEVFDGEKADLIVCDGAPDVTGFHDLDEFLQLDLLKSALHICTKTLKTGSNFVGKCFRGAYSGYIVHHFLKFFDRVDLVKPRASRHVSIECFLVCFGFKDANNNPFEIDVDCDPVNVRVVTCGDGPDPDFANEKEVETIHPISPPINPPYEELVDFRKRHG